jgi:hypothetical protein
MARAKGGRCQRCRPEASVPQNCFLYANLRHARRVFVLM